MNIAERIQKLRKSRNLSQEQLADAVGVSRQAVSKWESSGAVPDIDKIIALSDFFDTTTDYMLKGESPPERKNTFLNVDMAIPGRRAMNILGSIVSLCLWFEYQRNHAVLAGISFIVFGNMLLFMSLATVEEKEKYEKLYKYLKTNIWIMAFVPVSAAVTLLTGFRMGPVPVLTMPPVTMIAFLIVYPAVCIAALKAVKNRI